MRYRRGLWLGTLRAECNSRRTDQVESPSGSLYVTERSGRSRDVIRGTSGHAGIFGEKPANQSLEQLDGMIGQSRDTAIANDPKTVVAIVSEHTGQTDQQRA